MTGQSAPCADELILLIDSFEGERKTKEVWQKMPDSIEDAAPKEKVGPLAFRATASLRLGIGFGEP